MTTIKRLPALFIGHGGGPLPILDCSDPLPPVWKQHIADLFPRTPASPDAVAYSDVKAIVVVSAHYESHDERVRIGGAARPQMIYDYSGFPPESYKLQYPAPGSPQLAQRIAEALAKSGVPYAVDANRGFDHGVFVPLMVMFPEAKIPVVPVSILSHQDPRRHMDVGRALSALRDEGVFILGSGMSSHNFQYLFGQKQPRLPIAGQRFHETLNAVFTAPDGSISGAGAHTLRDSEMTTMLGFLSWPDAHEAQTKGHADHFMPLFTCMGSSAYFSERSPEQHQHPEVIWSGVTLGCATTHVLFRS
jgi:aromatic ring-opening dioxygenase catalytic subunit (LigB family)